jgi:excisionase family DNA binding protein
VPVTARERLELALSPAVLDALQELVDERVADALAAVPTTARWLTVEQAAARLACSPDAVRMRAKRGRLEIRHQGRRVYVSAESVDRLA